VWYLVDDARLGSKARAAFDRADSGEATVIIPTVVLAEALYLAEKGRTKANAEQIFGIVENALNYRTYPLDLTIIEKAWELKKLTEIHDRVIVATAKRLGLELITRDEKIRESGYVPTLW
jgi:predicted nucleic acid-binding protein